MGLDVPETTLLIVAALCIAAAAILIAYHRVA